MNIQRIKPHIMSSLPRFALMLYAISPITEQKEWIFNTVFILSGGLGIISIGYAIYAASKGFNAFARFMVGAPKDNLNDLMLAIVGLTVCYSMDLGYDAWLWWLIFVVAILELLYPTKM